MARTNSCGVTEKAEFNINLEVYQSEHERIFGSKKKPCGYCNDTGIEADSSDRCRRGCDLSPEIIEDANALCPELLICPCGCDNKFHDIYSVPSTKITFHEFNPINEAP